MEQRWRATWFNNEREPREFVFDSLNNLMIAKIDFALKFNHAYAGPIPEKYELEEVNTNDGANSGIACTQLRW